MPSDWTDLTVEDVQRLAWRGRVITDGPLNRTFAAALPGRDLFVRERLVHDDSYGQQFAGERLLEPALADALRVPRLLQVLSDAGRERFALFEFVPGGAPVWTRTRLVELAAALALVHSRSGSGLGDLAREASPLTPDAFLRRLLEEEIRRLPDGAPGELDLGPSSSLWGRLGVFEDEPIVLCHGDVHRHNFLTTAEGALAVVDWEAVRYRVAAADFNQMRHRWLDRQQWAWVRDAYLDATGREASRFERQVRVLRILWHLRTYNFHTRVLRAPEPAHAVHLRAARRLLNEAG